MQPIDEQALEAAAWQDFVHHLGDHLAGQWPAMPERLGERYGAFIDLAVQQALLRGLGLAAGVARFVNLWFVWGPAFHDKPGYQWAQDILARVPDGEWLALHQLVQRSAVELTRLRGARIEPATLEAADARVCHVFGPWGRVGAMARRAQRPAPPPLPRRACDLEAAELRVVDEGGAFQALQQRYELQAGEWLRGPAPMPAPLRITLGAACPPALALVSSQAGHGAVARLQARLRAHHVCNGDVHPAAGLAGPHGRWTWAGHETRAFNWPLATREQAPLPAGPGTLIAEETSPELYQLAFETCALRDEGEALGPQQATVSVWPTEQWLLDVVRDPAESQSLQPGTRVGPPGRTVCRVERDGQAQDAHGVTAQFMQGLDGAVAQALGRLVDAWAALPGLATPRCEAALALLTGRAGLAWGWQLSALDTPALMRVLARLDLVAGLAMLEFGGELSLRGSRSRLSLRADGRSELRLDLLRDTPEPALAAALLPAVARWRWGFALNVDPLAGESLALAQPDGPVSGALVGEAGLRPATHGRSGWEWYALLRIDPVVARLRVVDPLLGESVSVHTLLAPQTLVDWSMG